MFSVELRNRFREFINSRSGLYFKDHDLKSLEGAVFERQKVCGPRVKPIRHARVRKPVVKRRAAAIKGVSKIVAIGASTGGPQALQLLLSGLPHDLPAGMIIVQHMSKGSITGMAGWLEETSSVDIEMAASGEFIKSATALLAPDDYHTRIDEKGAINLSESMDEGVHHVPAIDIMMRSAALVYGKDAVGVIMTGMGRDGVDGIRAIKEAGGTTIAQDEKTSAVFGMNKLAIESGYIDKVVPLGRIAYEIVKAVNR